MGYRGMRWWRPEFGTKIDDAAGYGDVEKLAEEMKRVISIELSKSRRYTVSSINITSTNGNFLVNIVVYLDFEGQIVELPVFIEISLG